MELDKLANCLEKLGHPTRLAIFQLLVQAGANGLSVGELQDRLRIPSSTLSHHVLFLVTAGLIRQQREARVLRCWPNFDLMRGIVQALTAECCAGVPSHKPVEVRQDKRIGR
jgi:DNA-binding transcriptional ArsR family regulator